MELLEVFCRDAEASFELLEQEPDAVSLRSFTTLIHALKSALANTGADGLSQRAAFLEKAGRESDMPANRAKLPSFREELADLTARIEEIAAEARHGESGKQAKPELRETLTRLREALEAKDFEAIDSSLAHLRALPQPKRTYGAVWEIAEYILTADFQKAEDVVATLLNQRD
jgi:HPt (histidine-containing phosphotransfer) domain-containing protein